MKTKMAKSKNKIEKKMNAFFATRFAMRKDEAEKLASVNFDWELKENGEPECPNVIDRREDGVAVIHVDGALSYRTDLWTAWFGMDTYNSIEAAFDEVMNDRRVKAVLLDINSPGGEVSGCADLAEKIFNARGKKPIVARTGGLMCSAAYWIGSACDKVFTASNGTLGSIGVLCAYNKNEESNIDVVVSDLSPDKAPTPDTDEGLALIKQELNDLAEVFIGAVAKHRNTTAIDVANNYGKGGVFIGQKAVDANLADGVASLDEVCAIALGADPIEFTNNKKRGDSMAEQNNAAPTAEEIAKKAIAAYKQSISDVKALFEACHVAEDATAFVDGGKTLADAKEFAFAKMQENVCAMEKAHAETVAAKDAEIAQLKADLDAAKSAKPEAELSEAQKLAIQKGLEAESAAANSVEGGSVAQAGFKKMMKAAFKKGAESFKAK